MSVLDRTILALLERDDSMRTGLTFTAIKRRLEKVNVMRKDATISGRLRALTANGSVLCIQREVRGGTQPAWRLSSQPENTEGNARAV